MGNNNDAVLNAAVAKVNQSPEPEAPEPEVPVKKPEVKAKPPIEDVPEQKEEKQLDLIRTEKKKFKVKSYGKEKEIEIADEELPEYIQKGHSATEKWKQAQEVMRKASEIEKRNQEFAEAFKKDPEKAMELILGRETLDSLSEKRIMRQIQMEKMTPEQRELYEIKERIAAAKKEEEEIVSKRQAKEQEEKETFFEAQFKTMTTDALKKIGFEAPTKMIMNRFLLTMRPFLSHAQEQATPEDLDILATHFKKTMDDEFREHFSKMDGAQLAAQLGQENVEKIRKHLLTGHTPPNQPQKKPVKKEEKEPMLARDYFNSL